MIYHILIIINYFYLGLHLFAIYGAIGYGVGREFGKFNQRRLLDREEAIWDYVERHPEDFPELCEQQFQVY